jgi:hypothetical protein
MLVLLVELDCKQLAIAQRLPENVGLAAMSVISREAIRGQD